MKDEQQIVVVAAKRESMLTDIVRETLWMARRYADQRMTFAPTTVNEAIDTALAMGIEIQDDNDIGRYARDGQLGNWMPAKGAFSAE